MNNIVTLLADAAAWLVGGTIFAPLIARLHRTSSSSEPICGCEHHLAQHDPVTGECHEIVFRGAGRFLRCTCRRYVGPIPPELIIAQPLGYTKPGLVGLRTQDTQPLNPEDQP